MEDYLKELRKRTKHMPLLIPHSIVVLFNKEGQVLLEERADDGFFDFPLFIKVQSKVLAKGIMERRNNLEERADDGYFDFPGGGIDLKEEADKAAYRELLEETGLVAEELQLFKVYSGEITHYVYFNGDEIYGIDLVYICHKYHGELKPQLEEVKSLKFYSLKDMPGKMSIRNKQIIIDLLESKKVDDINSYTIYPVKNND